MFSNMQTNQYLILIPNMFAKKYLPNYTYLDYEKWEGRWELIDGIPFAMSPAPSIKHQRISAKLARYFDESLENCDACFVSLPINWKIKENLVLQPDIVVICTEASGNYLETVPDLVVEILSPSTAHKDRHLKYEIYQSQGVRYYLIVNPKTDMIEVFVLNDKVFELASTLPAENQSSFSFITSTNCNFIVDFSTIF